eukprot:TRINITY_DN8366_c0_g3_i2.p1 TRINITY_DN8366_c0_g3~~TRINITY_DN8366_c0_g3_i2.p1  ORF type:complete len:354 (-),score=49.09 TRINITY_DN8366_c0_g3_i2:275-1336(-)
MESRWRIVQCDCLDCVDPSERASYLQGAFSSAARQEPPPKCFIFLADGFVNENLINSSIAPHLNGIARAGTSGFLAVRKNLENNSKNLLTQLFGMVDKDGQLLQQCKTLQDRFKGMKVSMVSHDENIVQIAKQVGCEIYSDFFGQNDVNYMFDPKKTSNYILKKLGIQENEDQNLSDEIDILIFHLNQSLGVAETPDSKLQWMDQIIRNLNMSQKFTSEVISILLLTSNESSSLGGAKKLLRKEKEIIQIGKPMQFKRKGQHSSSKIQGQNQDFLSIVRPAQSFEFLGLDNVEVDDARAVLCVKKLAGVFRCDECSKIGFKECYDKGGDIAILIDRFLHEIAYKLARAPKYGA